MFMVTLQVHSRPLERPSRRRAHQSEVRLVHHSGSSPRSNHPPTRLGLAVLLFPAALLVDLDGIQQLKVRLDCLSCLGLWSLVFEEGRTAQLQ